MILAKDTLSLTTGSHRYCLKPLKVAFDNALRPKRLPGRREGSHSNTFPIVSNQLDAGNDVEVIVDKEHSRNSNIDKEIYDYAVDDEDRQGVVWEKLLKDSSSRNISPKDAEKQKAVDIVVPAEKDLKNLRVDLGDKNVGHSVNGSRKLDRIDGTLNLDELDFHPWCNITTREAVTAIHRATTQACKHEIANITCLMQQGMLYPKRLPRYCPLKGDELSPYIGCFKDRAQKRLLSNYSKKLVDNSPTRCVDMCLQSGYQYAGVQYSKECFCGKERPHEDLKLSEDQCNMNCPQSPHEKCGGYFTMNVYHTGLPKMVKLDPKPAVQVSETDTIGVVFLLTVNGRAVRQVYRLINSLFSERHYFYIHVDSRQDYLYRELKLLEKHFPNIRLSDVRLSTIWGGASLLQMLLSCISELLLLKDWNWDYVINLSESDFPIKSLSSLERFLIANNGKNFVKSHGQDTQRKLLQISGANFNITQIFIVVTGITNLDGYWQNDYHFLDKSPPTDDSRVSIYESFARLGLKQLQTINKSCKVKLISVVESTLFNMNDVFKGLLILYKAQPADGNKPVILETQVRPIQHYIVYKGIGPTGRLKFLQVGSEYDLKEQVFRNFGRILGPFSDVGLIHRWGPGTQFSATFVWVDPTNTVAGSYEVKIEAGNQVLYHKPTFRQPLRPGTWSLKLLYEWELVAETFFLIIPLSVYNGHEVSSEQVKFLHNGPGQPYVDHDFSNVEALLGYANKSVQARQALSNSRRYGKDLKEWTDTLVSSFWSVQDTCFVNQPLHPSGGALCLDLELDPCHLASWSSHADDPKSTIRNIGVNSKVT
ncbi:Xylosyltransferase oxt [Araneus ventricosus]|uniref:protein xylosyltransferase n=2 Tax=Araneus ventricosus TaxID=182803 RepID=A0A4Y2ISU9_ARAVE|nr:Xylosyltransferase oxt [Araneus ventricosus]